MTTETENEMAMTAMASAREAEHQIVQYPVFIREDLNDGSSVRVPGF